jgi:hypothetical protein
VISFSIYFTKRLTILEDRLLKGKRKMDLIIGTDSDLKVSTMVGNI